jgi:AcrR family transcriptional regulator
MVATVACARVRAQGGEAGRQRSFTSEPFRWDAGLVVQEHAVTPRTRAQRVDARSNAHRIVAVARAAFLAGEAPSLEEIAAHAGVGVATLYRHFPNREALVRAAYHAIFDDEIIPLLAPELMLPAFRDTFIGVSVQVIGLLSAAPTSNLAELNSELVQEHMDLFAVLLQAAQEHGDIRTDIGIEDVPHILDMIVLGLSAPSLDDARRARYLALIYDALKPGNTGELPPLP